MVISVSLAAALGVVTEYNIVRVFLIALGAHLNLLQPFEDHGIVILVVF